MESLESLPLGTIEVSAGASSALATAGTDPAYYLARHQRGDWGTADSRSNEWAIRHGHQVESEYKLDDGTEILIITAFDRSLTRVLLTSEYEDRWVSTREGYAAWSTIYDQEKNGLIAVEQSRVDALVSGLPVGSVLDAGAGTGRHALRLARRGLCVTAMDQSPEMLAIAQKRARQEGLEIDFRLGKIDEELPFESNRFDLVICALVLTHDVDLRRAVQGFHRVLTPGGYLLITDWHPDCVAVLGWRTCFVKPGITYVLPNAGHTRDEYLEAIAAAGFALHSVTDIALGEVPEGYLPWPLEPEDAGKPWCLIVLSRKRGGPEVPGSQQA